jgi:hypothetical protein
MPLPCVIDIEASGFGRTSYPVEVGFVLPDGSARCMLVRPPEEWTHWDSQAQRVHRLSRPLLMRHGKSAVEVADLLNEQLAGRNVYSDNWAHDHAWLARLYQSAASSPAFRLRHLRELLDEEQAARWDEACTKARAGTRAMRHRASNDARVLQRAWASLQPEAAQGAA